jgi:hypothetical protein
VRLSTLLDVAHRREQELSARLEEKAAKAEAARQRARALDSAFSSLSTLIEDANNSMWSVRIVRGCCEAVSSRVSASPAALFCAALAPMLLHSCVDLPAVIDTFDVSEPVAVSHRRLCLCLNVPVSVTICLRAVCSCLATCRATAWTQRYSGRSQRRAGLHPRCNRTTPTTPAVTPLPSWSARNRETVLRFSDSFQLLSPRLL